MYTIQSTKQTAQRMEKDFWHINKGVRNIAESNDL